MYCRKCGNYLEDDAQFCSYCRTPVLGNRGRSNNGGYGSNDGGNGSGSDGVSPDVLREYVIRGSIGVAALILSVIAIAFLVRLVSTIEGTITTFSRYDGLASGIGIACYVACGSVLMGVAALAALPVVRYTLEGPQVGSGAIDRSMVLSIALLVLCIAVWICKLIFHSPVGSDVSGVLYTVFSTFGESSMGCLMPTIVALAILYFVRLKLMPYARVRY